MILLLIALALAGFLIYSVIKSIRDNAPAASSPTPSPTVEVTPSPSPDVTNEPDEDGAVPPVVSGAEPTGGTEVSPSPAVTPGSSANTALTLEKTDISLFSVGETAQMKLTSSPSGTVTWKSSDEAVATVSSSGLVKAVGAGTANVTASAGGKTAACIVRVKLTAQTGGSGDTVTQASLNKTDITFSGAGESYALKVTGTDQTVTWTSGNTAVAKVDAGGKVTAVGEGTTTIRAKFGSTVLECIIRVKPQ